jgi:hypothetical protein
MPRWAKVVVWTLVFGACAGAGAYVAGHTNPVGGEYRDDPGWPHEHERHIGVALAHLERGRCRDACVQNDRRRTSAGQDAGEVVVTAGHPDEMEALALQDEAQRRRRRVGLAEHDPQRLDRHGPSPFAARTHVRTIPGIASQMFPANASFTQSARRGMPVHAGALPSSP